MPVGKKPGGKLSPDDQAIAEAKAAIEAGRFDDAERLARAVMARKPNHRGASHALGVLLLAHKKPADALSLLETAAAGGTDPVIETHLAMALRQTGRTKDAMACLERAVTREPPFAQAFHELGAMLDAQNHFGEAEAILRRGLKISARNPDTWCLLGSVLLMRGDRDGAQRAFARAQVERPGHPSALFGQACVLRDDGEFARAADFFGQALQRMPDWAEARLQLGYCLLELDRWDDAIAALRAAIALNPLLYDKARYMLVRPARGRFWLRPSALTDVIGAPPAS